MGEVILAINIEEGLLLSTEFSLGQHFGSFECFAHGHCLQMLDVVL